MSADTETLLEGDQRNLTSYRKVREILAEAEVVVVSMEHPDLFSPEGLDAVRRVSEALDGLPGVEDVKSLTHSVKPVRRGFSFEMVPLVPPPPYEGEELEALKRFCLGHPLVRDVIVASDGRHTLITVTYGRDLGMQGRQAALRRELHEALEPFEREGLRFQLLGLPLIEHEIRGTLRRDIERFVPAALALLLGVLWLTFRSWRILGLILLNQAFLLFLLPGVIELAGFSINVFSAMLFPLLTALHLMLLTHLCAAWQRAQWAGETGVVAAESAVREVGKASFFSALTSGVGLWSLTFTEVEQVREFGGLGAMGVALVFLITFGPGLASIALAGRRAAPVPGEAGLRRGSRWIHPSGESMWTGRLTDFIWRNRRVILGLAFASTIVIAVGLEKIRTDIRAVEFLNRRSPTRQAVEQLDRVYGGINVVQIEFDSGRTNGINQGDFLQFMDRVQRFAESKPEVSGVYSYPQLLAMMNQIWEQERPGSFRVPKNPVLIQVFVLALKSGNYPFLRALSDETFRTGYLVVRTRDMPSEKYLGLIKSIEDFAEKNKPPHVEVSAAKGLHSVLEADRRIIRSQWSSGGWSFLIIGLMLMFLWRSPVLALFSLLVNAVPVALVVAAAGYAQIPLNSITVMVAAISLGIAVDDSIHFITHWQDESRADPAASVMKTLRIKARPIISTSLVLIAVFSVFSLSSFPPVVDFGLLSSLAFAGALVSTLVFLPALLLSWSGRRAGRTATSGPTFSVEEKEAGG